MLKNVSAPEHKQHIRTHIFKLSSIDISLISIYAHVFLTFKMFLNLYVVISKRV